MLLGDHIPKPHSPGLWIGASLPYLVNRGNFNHHRRRRWQQYWKHRYAIRHPVVWYQIGSRRMAEPRSSFLPGQCWTIRCTDIGVDSQKYNRPPVTVRNNARLAWSGLRWLRASGTINKATLDIGTCQIKMPPSLTDLASGLQHQRQFVLEILPNGRSVAKALAQTVPKQRIIHGSIKPKLASSPAAMKTMAFGQI